MVRTLKIWRVGYHCLGIFLWLLFPIDSFGQEGEESIRESLLAEDSAKVNEDLEIDIVSLGLEIVPSGGGGTFFDEYRKLFGQASGLDPYVSPSIIGRIRLNNHLRLAFQTSYIGAGFDDLYQAWSTLPNGNLDTLIPTAQILEDFSVTALPVMVGIQYTPIRSQFTSYIGAMIGGAFVSTQWETDSRVIESRNFFRPSTNSDDVGFSPAVRLFTGVDLRFDRFQTSKNIIRGIFIEAAYFYLPVSRNYFQEIRVLAQNVPFLPAEDDAFLNLGGFSITLGVNVQLFRL